MADSLPSLPPMPLSPVFQELVLDARWSVILEGFGVPAELLEASSADGAMYAAGQAALEQLHRRIAQQFFGPQPLRPLLLASNPNAKSARR